MKVPFRDGISAVAIPVFNIQIDSVFLVFFKCKHKVMHSVSKV